MISLMYCGNDRVFKGLTISLLSVANNTKEALDVHILTADLRDMKDIYAPITEEMRCFLEKKLQQKNEKSKITLWDTTELFQKEMGESPNKNTPYTPYTLLRLLADLLPLPDRVIYLDTDTAACGDIAPLYHYNLEGRPYAGALDYLGKVFINPRYINAGVLVFDLKTVRESGFFAKAREKINQKKMPFPDQDAINRISGHKCFFPRCYNEQRRMRKDTVIRHFSKSIRFFPYYHTVNIKPWEIEKLHTVYKNHEFDGVLSEYLDAMDEYHASLHS